MGVEFGYAGKILRVDLSSASISYVPTSDHTDKFVGGRGLAAKIYWDEVPPEASAFDPRNRLIFATGPLAAVSVVAGSRWEICGKSPATQPEHFTYGNLGGTWGAHLKLIGYDGLVIHGKSDRPVYLLIQDGAAELRDAAAIWGKDSIEVRHILKSELGNSARVVTIGLAGENLVSMATVLAEDDSAGTAFGAVMGSKKLKAIVVRGVGHMPAVAYPERLRELSRHVHELKPDVARDFRKWMQVTLPSDNLKQQHCYGCMSGCHRGIYEASNGDKGKFYCQAGNFYKRRALRYYGVPNEVAFQATRLCDKYGLDTKSVEPIIEWLSRCYRAGVLTDESTGIPISKSGSLEFMETLVRKISYRDGFGDVLAQGIYRAADSVGSKARELITDYADKAGQVVTYGARSYITPGLFEAVEPREAVAQLHAVSRRVIKWKNWNNGAEGAYMSSKVIRAIAERFWGSEIAADFSTYEGKALAAKMIQEREYAIACLILCNQLWPIMDVELSPDHVGDPALESKLYSAVSGKDVDKKGLRTIGERVFNLQRAIIVREGHRGREDDRLAEYNYTIPVEDEHRNSEGLVPGKDGEPISRRGAVVDREKFQRMLDEYYQLRGWDIRTGLQTTAKLQELGLEDVAIDLKARGLLPQTRVLGAE